MIVRMITDRIARARTAPLNRRIGTDTSAVQPVSWEGSFIELYKNGRKESLEIGHQCLETLGIMAISYRNLIKV